MHPLGEEFFSAEFSSPKNVKMWGLDPPKMRSPPLFERHPAGMPFLPQISSCTTDHRRKLAPSTHTSSPSPIAPRPFCLCLPSLWPVLAVTPSLPTAHTRTPACFFGSTWAVASWVDWIGPLDSVLCSSASFKQQPTASSTSSVPCGDGNAPQGNPTRPQRFWIWLGDVLETPPPWEVGCV